MKKFIKVACVMMLAITLVGCGEGKKETSEQEKVVDNFFEYIKKGELKKIEKITSTSYSDDLDLSSMMDEYEEYIDEDMYGKAFSDEAEKFMKNVFENMIREYKIKDVKEKDGETIIKVTGKRVDTDVLEDMDIEEESMEIMEKYQTENEDRIRKLLEEKGQQAAMEEVFGDVAKEIFTLVSDKVKEAKSVNFTFTFTLVKEDGKWLIDKIDEKGAKTSDSKKEEENEDSGYKTYKVDPAKQKADATLLKKGRLADDSYYSEKTVETDLEFIDYNVVNGSGQEIDKYGMIDTTDGKLTIQSEVHGNKGSKIIISIGDDRDQITFDEYTLDDTKQIFTKELTGFDTNAKYLTVKIYIADSYEKDYDFGDEVGSFMISKDE